jgi:hypothetical protein
MIQLISLILIFSAFSYVLGVVTGWKLAMRRMNLQLDEMQQDKSNPT